MAASVDDPLRPIPTPLAELHGGGSVHPRAARAPAAPQKSPLCFRRSPLGGSAEVPLAILTMTAPEVRRAGMATQSRQAAPPRLYRPRVVDAEVAAALAAAGAVLIEEPRACGKTSTASQVAASEICLDVDPAARAAAGVDPALVLEGPVPRLIDEWQLEPGIWNNVRRAVDDRGAPGQFILTRSAVPADDATRHVGAGRIVRLRMRPMTLAEAGHPAGTVSLAAVVAGEPVRSLPGRARTLDDHRGSNRLGSGTPLADTAPRFGGASLRRPMTCRRRTAGCARPSPPRLELAWVPVREPGRARSSRLRPSSRLPAVPLPG